MTELVDRDQEHLDLLSLFHYITAGVTFVFACFPLIHVAVGLAMMAFSATTASTGAKDAPPAFMGAFLAAIGGTFVAAGWSLAALHFFTARFLKQRRRYWFCMVVSGLSTLVCMFSNAVVGIATVIVLSRPSVRTLFEQNNRPGEAAGAQQ